MHLGQTLAEILQQLEEVAGLTDPLGEFRRQLAKAAELGLSTSQQIIGTRSAATQNGKSAARQRLQQCLSLGQKMTATAQLVFFALFQLRSLDLGNLVGQKLRLTPPATFISAQLLGSGFYLSNLTAQSGPSRYRLGQLSEGVQQRTLAAGR